MDLKTARPTVFLAVTDTAEATLFYRDKLGLRLVEDSQFALVFDMAGCELRLSKVPQHTPLPFTVLDWQVEDVADAAEQLQKAGVPRADFDGIEVDASGLWSSPDGGAKIFWFRDPDGNVLSLSQRS